MRNNLKKLHLGCGGKKLDGWINVDIEASCSPDEIVDLEKFPWPWQDDSVDHILMSHVLEHLGERRDIYLQIIQELYRVCVDGALIEIHVPHPRHDHFLWDPTHVRAITAEGLLMFDKQTNLQWIQENAANTPLGIYLGVDFRIDKVNYQPDPVIQKQLESGEISASEFHSLLRTQNNICQQIDIDWRVVKSNESAPREIVV